MTGDELRQKIRPAQIRAEDVLERVLAGLEEVGAHARAATGVVHERVHTGPARANRTEKSRVLLSHADIGRAIEHVGAEFSQRRENITDRFLRPETADREVPALGGQRARNAEADAPRAAGDDGDRPFAGH